MTRIELKSISNCKVQLTVSAVVKSKRLPAFQEDFQNILVVFLHGEMMQVQVDQYERLVHRSCTIGGRISVLSLKPLI